MCPLPHPSRSCAILQELTNGCARCARSALLVRTRLAHPEQIVAHGCRRSRRPRHKRPFPRPWQVHHLAHLCLRPRRPMRIYARNPCALAVGLRAVRTKEREELIRVHELVVRVRSACNETQQLLCNEDGKEIRGWRAGDRGEKEVSTGLSTEWAWLFRNLEREHGPLQAPHSCSRRLRHCRRARGPPSSTRRQTDAPLARGPRQTCGGTRVSLGRPRRAAGPRPRAVTLC